MEICFRTYGVSNAQKPGSDPILTDPPMVYPQAQCEFVFLTNAMPVSALLLAELYKNRWTIELFFKWLKQHLKIITFGGTSVNAARIPIDAAICTYCLVATVQKKMQAGRSTYEVRQVLSISLTDKTLIRELFDKKNFNTTKNNVALMNQVYRMIFNRPIFYGTRMKYRNK